MWLSSYLVHRYFKARSCHHLGGRDLRLFIIHFGILRVALSRGWKGGGITSEGFGVQQQGKLFPEVGPRFREESKACETKQAGGCDERSGGALATRRR